MLSSIYTLSYQVFILSLCKY